jgi:hypothetical protein
MSIDSRSIQQPVQPSYPQPTPARKAVTLFLAALVSSTLLGGMLTLFEMRSEETAMARASFKTQPTTDRLSIHKLDARPRA